MPLRCARSRYRQCEHGCDLLGVRFNAMLTAKCSSSQVFWCEYAVGCTHLVYNCRLIAAPDLCRRLGRAVLMQTIT